MSDLATRAFRVALYGRVPEDDPTIIADLVAEIERLQALVGDKYDYTRDPINQPENMR